MTLEELIAIADGAPLPKEDVNVRLPLTTEIGGPLIRTLISVRYVKKGQQRWIYWFWTPRPSHDGMFDYGFSGQLLCNHETHP